MPVTRGYRRAGRRHPAAIRTADGGRPRNGVRLGLRQSRQRFPAARRLRAVHLRGARRLGGLEDAPPARPWTPSCVCARGGARRGAGGAGSFGRVCFRSTRLPARRAYGRAHRLLRLSRAGGRREIVAVNPDRRESDLEAIPAETLELWRNTGGGAAAPRAGTGAGEPGGWSSGGTWRWRRWRSRCWNRWSATCICARGRQGERARGRRPRRRREQKGTDKLGDRPMFLRAKRGVSPRVWA